MTLKPCPFCGGTNLLPTVRGRGDQKVNYIACRDCEARGPEVPFRHGTLYLDKARAMTMWNTRATRADAGGEQ